MTKGDQIRGLLQSNPGLTNNEIAHQVGAGSAYVNDIRVEMGLTVGNALRQTGAPSAMACPACDGLKTQVVDTRSADCGIERGIRRRRKCGSCGHRWSTYETSKPYPTMDEMKAMVMADLLATSGKETT